MVRLPVARPADAARRRRRRRRCPAGRPSTEFLALEKGERVLALTSLVADSPGLALGTASGVVKRVAADYPSNKDSWEVIALRDGDEVVGAVELPPRGGDLVFVTSDAQLLRFGAEKVRPQGRAAGGMAGIKLATGARVIFFGAVDRAEDGEWASVVVTVAGSSDALPGHRDRVRRRSRRSPSTPARAARPAACACHRFLKGEDALVLAWAGPAPALAVGPNGSPAALPAPDSRRDGSGVPAPAPITTVGAHAVTPPQPGPPASGPPQSGPPEQP